MDSGGGYSHRAVVDLGQQWEKVSERVGRMSSDCRDRYRNHIANRELRVTGPWSKEEEDELTRIVTEMTIQQGKDLDNDVFWGIVSDRMGNRRGRQQCRIKWYVGWMLAKPSRTRARNHDGAPRMRIFWSTSELLHRGVCAGRRLRVVVQSRFTQSQGRHRDRLENAS